MNFRATSPPAPLVSSPDALAELLDVLQRTERLAVDTEADSLHCYFEKLCLIQISVPGCDVLVDPLAGFSLDPLFGVFAAKPLVFHGGDYDLRLLRRSGNFEVATIFDTMIAARLTGLTEFNLAALVQKYFGVALPKGSQKANWARRPLTAQMSEYAMNDTRYLLQLSEKLAAELHTLGRWEWFEQSCQKAIRTSRLNRERDLETAWRITGSAALRGREAAILRELWNWREEEAKAVDRPPFHILRNEELIEFAQRLAGGSTVNPQHLNGTRRQRFFAAVEKAMHLGEEDWPKWIRGIRTRPTPEEERRFVEYRKRRDAASARLKLDPALIAPKAALEAMAASPESAPEILLPWQRELLGF